MSIFFTKQPLVLNVELAETIGLNEAIILQQLHYWIEKSVHIHEGRRWVYNTYAEWKDQFPWWSERTIQRIILNLEERGLILVGNFNKIGIDRTKWYTVNYDHDKLAPSTNQKVRPSRQIGTMDHDKLAPPITREYTETTKKKKECTPKQQFAEFVTLTEAEHKKLIERFGEVRVPRFIEILNNHKGAKGTKYKSDYHAILNWVVEAESKRFPQQQQGSLLDQPTQPAELSYLEKMERMIRGE